MDESLIVSAYMAGNSTVSIGKQFNIHYATVRDILVRNDIKLRSNKQNSRQYCVDHTFFNSIDTEEKAYWLGFMAADGYVSSTNGKRVGLALSSCDEAHIQKFLVSLKSNYKISRYRSKGYSTNEYSRIVIYSDELYDALVKNGVVEHKTKVMEFPLFLDKSLLRHYIRGYFDGDGCLSISDKVPQSHFLGTKEFLDNLSDYLEENKIVVNRNYYQRRSGCTALDMRLSGKNLFMFLNLIYTNASIVLDRKYEKYKEATAYFSRLYQ